MQTGRDHSMQDIVDCFDKDTGMPKLSREVLEWPVAKNELIYGDAPHRADPKIFWNDESVWTGVFSVLLTVGSVVKEVAGQTCADILWDSTYDPMRDQGAIGVKHTVNNSVKYADVIPLFDAEPRVSINHAPRLSTYGHQSFVTNIGGRVAQSAPQLTNITHPIPGATNESHYSHRH